MYLRKALYKHQLLYCLVVFLLMNSAAFASYLLIPMDEESQSNHLKAYGITFQSL